MMFPPETLTIFIEVYESLMNVNPEFRRETFNQNSVQYNLQRGDVVCLPSARSSCYGINSLAFHGSLLWNSLLSNESHNLKEFKTKS